MVSPHLDDAVLSCGQFAASHPGSRFLTVFAGGPTEVDPLPPFDRAARYFRAGDDVAAIRRAEDVRACSIVGARPEHLEFWDGHYRTEEYGYEGPPDEEIAAAVGEALDRLAAAEPADVWLVPLGLGHHDHRVVSDVCLTLVRRAGLVAYVYADLPYYEEAPAEALGRQREIEARGFVLREVDTVLAEGAAARKRAAVRAHRSQRRSLGRRARRAVRASERCWTLDGAGGRG